MRAIILMVFMLAFSFNAIAQEFDSEIAQVTWSVNKSNNMGVGKEFIWISETLGNRDLILIGDVTKTESIKLNGSKLIFPQYNGHQDKVVYYTIGGVHDDQKEAYSISQRVQA